LTQTERHQAIGGINKEGSQEKWAYLKNIGLSGVDTLLLQSLKNGQLLSLKE
jgi:hypothetical protein